MLVNVIAVELVQYFLLKDLNSLLFVQFEAWQLIIANVDLALELIPDVCINFERESFLDSALDRLN